MWVAPIASTLIWAERLSEDIAAVDKVMSFKGLKVQEVSQRRTNEGDGEGVYRKHLKSPLETLV